MDFGFYGRPRKNIPLEEEIEKTDEELNKEWMRWIDERTKSFSIEPVIINRFAKDWPPKWYFDNAEYSEWLEWNTYGQPDVYVYPTPYGILEFEDQIVENYIAKPADVIVRARARRDPILGPIRKKNRGFQPYEQTILINPRTSPVNDVPSFSFEFKCHYKNLCEDMYETYDESKVNINFLTGDLGYLNFEKLISFDRHTGELCLKMYTVSKNPGTPRNYPNSIFKKAGRLRFNLSIDESRQQQIIDFVCKGSASVYRTAYCGECEAAYDKYRSLTNTKDEVKNYNDVKSHLIKQLNDSLKLLCEYHKLTKKFFEVNEIEMPKDSALFFNRKLTNLAIPFMKKIRQTLINICIFLDIPVGSTFDELIHKVWF